MGQRWHGLWFSDNIYANHATFSKKIFGQCASISEQREYVIYNRYEENKPFLYATCGTFKKSESRLVQKQLFLWIVSPLISKRDTNCVWIGNIAVLFVHIMCYGVGLIFVDSNHSHNGSMVKDKHAKAL